MLRLAFVLALTMLCGIRTATADTYTWTDEAGVINFTDDPGQIPLKFRSKAKKGEDITIRNPKVQADLKEQQERALQAERNRPRIPLTPDYVPPPQSPPMVETPPPATDDLPPGRTKSQRIRDNIQRRQAEERARQSGGQNY